MTEPRKKRGRPPHQPTPKRREEVELLVAFGNTHEQIAMVVGVDVQTLRLHYGNELAAGLVNVNKRVAENLVRQAMKDDPRAFSAIKFWLNCRAGWNEYSPQPRAAEPLGKKEIARIEAETAEAGTGWSGLVH